MSEKTSVSSTSPDPRWWQKPTDRDERLNRILACLREDARMSLREISNRTNVPISTVFDSMRRIRGRFWFTAVFLDARAQKIRANVATRPTTRHPELAEAVV